MSGEGRLLAGPEPPAPRHAAVFLVGGYDGSGNYGDMLQLQATLELLARLGPAVTPIPVIELEYRASHDELSAVSPQLRTAPVCYFDSRDAEPPADLRRLELPDDLPFAALYLYGGGYLNPTWGDRKLGMALAAEATVRAAGLSTACRLSSGLQVDPQWAAGLDGPGLELLERLEPFGVRDAQSLPGFVVDGASRLTGDDAIGVLSRHPGAGGPEASGGALRVNVHLVDGSWVTDDPAALVDFFLRLLGALEAAVGTRLEIQPVIAYDDRRISEREIVARLAAEPSVAGRIAGEPVTLRPGDLGRSLDVLERASLTVTCSYHVGLTSSFVGVPAALLAGNPYYRQKAAGLSREFGLPDAFTIDPHGSPDAAAQRLADTLLDAAARERLASELRLGALRSVVRRREAELEIAGRLSEALVSALLARDVAPASAPAAELRERLALLRIDHAELLASFDRLRARKAEADAIVAEQAAHIEEQSRKVDELWAELQRYVADKEHLGARTADLERALHEQSVEAERLRRAHAHVVESASWKLTAPLRRAARLGKRG